MTKKMGVPTTQHCKIGFGPALRKVEASYYAERALQPITHVITDEERKMTLRAAQRASRSKLTERVVAQIRYLRESRGWTPKPLSEKFGISRSMASNICDYQTWPEVMPSSEGLDVEAHPET